MTTPTPLMSQAMSTKLNASEIAEKGVYEVATNYTKFVGVRCYVHQWDVHEKALGKTLSNYRAIYAAAVKEVAQPLADERDEYREALEALIKADEWALTNLDSPRSARVNYGNVAKDARAILSKYKRP